MVVELAFAMAKLCNTFGAAKYVASPACEAVIVQLPAPVMWTVFPAIVQSPLAAKATGKLG